MNGIDVKVDDMGNGIARVSIWDNRGSWTRCLARLDADGAWDLAIALQKSAGQAWQIAERAEAKGVVG